MSDPDFTDSFPDLPDSRVAIVGLGLMGGSLAKALHGRCRGLLGVDLDPPTLDLASELGIFEALSEKAGELLPEADAIILAAPVRAVLSLISELPRLQPGPALVLDICSTKVEVARALSGLPSRFAAVGGHPMCGKEHSGLAYAEAGIFRQAPFAFTPLPNTPPAARRWAGRLADALGAEPLWMDAADHDRWVAATSHTPYLLACALAAATPADSAPLAGPGYRSTARLAASPPALMMDVISTNSEQVRRAVTRLLGALHQVEDSLNRGDYRSLQDWLESSRAHHLALIAHPDGSVEA